MIKILGIVICQALLVSAANSQKQTKTKEAMESTIERLLGQMTLEEKASLCSGRDNWSTKPIERFDIPWVWLSDGPHGVRRAPTTDKPGFGDQLPATCFPTASALEKKLQ